MYPIRTAHRRRFKALAVAVLAAAAVSVSGAIAVAQPHAAALELVAAATPAPRSPVPVFVLDNGRFTVFDPPGDQANEVVDLNDRGEVAGTYIDRDGTNRGFLRDRRGRVDTFVYPGAERTFVNKINVRGQIVGNAFVPAASDNDGRRAYLRDPDGSFTTIRVPGAVTTQALGLDNRGRVVGDYLDTAGVLHGYLWERGRFVTTSVDGPEGTGATLTGLNDRGQMIGVYQAGGTTGRQGFLLDRGVYRTFQDPRLAFTAPLDINNRGQIVGFTADALPIPVSTEVHGFLLSAGADGRLASIDVPGAPRTLASGIDERGRVAGFYENANPTPGG
jgi:hypothetical protein